MKEKLYTCRNLNKGHVKVPVATIITFSVPNGLRGHCHNQVVTHLHPKINN
jgi:hypothetical protein